MPEDIENSARPPYFTARCDNKTPRRLGYDKKDRSIEIHHLTMSKYLKLALLHIRQRIVSRKKVHCNHAKIKREVMLGH